MNSEEIRFRLKSAWLSRHRLAVFIFSVAVVLSTALISLAVFGLQLDGAAYRQKLSTVLSAQLGRPVHIDGALHIQLSLRPALLIGGLRIGNPASFGSGDLLTVGEARVALHAWPLLQRRLQADALSASRVSLHLRQRLDGSNNWTFNTGTEAALDAGPAVPADSAALKSWLAGIAIERISVAALTIDYQAPGAARHDFALDKLQASLPRDGPLTVDAEGRVEQTLGYKINVRGGPVGQLLSGSAGPWPLTMTLDFAGSTLALQGSMSPGGGSVQFGLGTPDLAGFGRVLSLNLPDAGVAGIAAQVSWVPGSVMVKQLSGVMGKTVLTGDMQIDLAGARPKISGAFSLPTLDLRPFLGAPQQDDAAPTNLRELYASLADARFSLASLNQVELDLSLQVEQWLSLPGEVKAAAMQVQLHDGKLAIPVKATVTGVPLAGEMTVDARLPVPRMRLVLAAQQSAIGGLAKLLTGAEGIAGQLGDLKLSLNAKGARVADLLTSLSAEMTLAQSRLSYGNVEGGKPVAIVIDKLALQLPAQQSLSGTLKASLLGRPLQASLTGGNLVELMQNAVIPLTLTLQTDNVVGQISGTFSAAAAQEGTALTFSLGAARAGDIGAWFGLPSTAAVPLVVGAKLSRDALGWQWRDVLLQLGNSSLYAELVQQRVGGKPVLQARLDISRVDIAELESLLPLSSPRRNRPRQTESSSEKSARTLDLPILPQALRLDDTDITVRVGDVLGSPLALAQMQFDGRIRDGVMQASPFSLNLAQSAWRGAVALDVRSADPGVQLWLSAADVNLGTLMAQLKLANGLDAALGHVSLYLNSHSSRLSGLIANASLNGDIEGGRLVLKDANTGARARIAIERGVLTAAPGKALSVDIKGALDDIPVAIGIKTASADALINPRLRIPFEAEVHAVATRLQLSGTVARELTRPDLALAMQIQGARLDHLNTLLRVSLPPWGPWSAAGQFRLSSKGYEVQGMRVQIGSSLLTGSGTLDTTARQPRLDVALAAPLIQLEDFRTDSWSATEGASMPGDVLLDEAALRKKATQTSDQVQGLLSPAFMRSLDAQLSVQVDQVDSGKDQLGSGSLQARLENGRAAIGPILVTMPGGSATWSLAYEAFERDVQADLTIAVDNFDYGVLARRVQPGSEMGGRFSLEMDVSSRASRLSEILRNGSGNIDFAVWPLNLKSGAFDLWAVNVLVALLPKIDPNNASTINCAVGRFSLDRGRLSQKQLVIDTSRMRVTGNAAANFADEKLDIRLQPQAKTAQFLSLATPISVRGSFNKFDVSVSPGDIVQTMVRLTTSVVWVPIKKLFSEKVPASGSDVCGITTLRAPAAALKSP